MGINLHEDLITKNHTLWNRKPVLRMAYHDLYRRAAEHLSNLPNSTIVELGSGMGHIREVIPQCITTELFPFPWIERIENAYKLSFADESISDLISTDVFHHLRYPGTALLEFWRVLRPGGRVILLEPYMSLLGLLVYGALHVEPVAVNKPIEWIAPPEWSANEMDYYAAQGNATRIFAGKRYGTELSPWKHVHALRYSALAYAASGGYSGPQLYPTKLYSWVKASEAFFDLFPSLFATRLLVVLEK